MPSHADRVWRNDEHAAEPKQEPLPAQPRNAEGAPRSVASAPPAETDRGSASVKVMFRLITTVRRGSASNLAAAWAHYPTIDAARVGASALLREDRVLRVMIVRDEIPPTFVEWSER